MKKRLRKITKIAAQCLVGMALLFLLIDRLAPVRTDVDFATIVSSREGTALHAYMAKDQQWRIKTRLDEITPELKRAILFKEDKHFYHHPGVNLLAIGRAIVNNIFHLKRTSGASTINMQVARMLDPEPRTYFNKCVELFRSLQLELHYSKEEILQLYLNLVPYGSNIQGVKAASLLYFNKTPDQLSLAEITALSIIPNRPNSMVMGKDNSRIIKERNKWLERFRKANLFPGTTIDDAIREPLTAYRHNAPNSVPQFAIRMRKSNPGNIDIRTSLDEKMQQNAEQIAGDYVNQLKLHNINNASVLVVNNETHEVLVYIGSSDFADRYHFGQVDGVRALRSPGSTLKPLLYGLSFDKGIITPKSVIADVPISIKGYSPENYDKLFRGNVTVEFALSNSLNIPAVKLLDKEGTGEFVNALNRAGFTSIYESRKKMGLSLILGGCGVRLDELTALYAAFANDGIYFPLRYTAVDDKRKSGAPPEASVPLLSPSANYMLTRILSELHRPDLPNAFDEAQGIPRIAWKTGTSYGRKDAWSIGYNRHYTIGVWLGNFSGAGVQELSGANTATPLLFKLFNTVDHNATNEWLEPPKQIAFRLVCAETGKAPDDFCHNQVMDYYIPGVSSNEKCDHYKETWLSADEKYCYCTSCLPPNGYITKLIPNVAPELAAFYDAGNVAYTRLPPHNPACTRVFKGQAPVITSLTNGMTYLIENKEQQKLQLSCTAANDVHKVYWYINDKFYAVTKANEKMFFSAQTQLMKISCTDDKGRNTNIEIKVRFI
jgi:penicillin-binding protein 1C